MVHIYEVTYAVTRQETYRVMAEDEVEATAFGFEEGHIIEDAGETLRVESLHTRKQKIGD